MSGPDKRLYFLLRIRIAREMLRRIDIWRAAQQDGPNRSEAIRRLIERGLARD